ncbi:hypothetical protein TrVE_jg5577 [Triparma verrucosa]|uniref:CS domain-containing protein n=1 Tax=Triparma verrucosa TaxID=1606542 RepID=A0A9W7EJU4_9STRA|nr:hypothetical protein TrVE_jg5577 [Triparma verrucosa]
MSSFDYSKWDNLDSDDSCDDSTPTQTIINTNTPPVPTDSSLKEEEEFNEASQKAELQNLDTSHLDKPAQVMESASKTPLQTSNEAPPLSITKKTADGRYIFSHQGRKVYEWSQTLETLEIYIDQPPVPSSSIYVVITPSSLKVGVKNYNQAYIDERTFSLVDVSSSTWLIVDSVIEITLQKVHKGLLWSSPLISSSGHNSELDPKSKEDVKKEIMLERFSEENPGFDFRGAEFNGNVPDARNFMGGVKYN